MEAVMSDSLHTAIRSANQPLSEPGHSCQPAAPASADFGLYLSIPFCRSKCTYCNFASGVYPASQHDRYVARLIADLDASRAWSRSQGLDLPATLTSIYFGGGTPVLLAPHHFEAIFAAIARNFQLAPGIEITIEAAPGQLADATLDALVRCGANRISLGVQSFVDRESAISGRLHTRAQVLADIARIRAAGIANLNLDLLAGLAGQTLDSWSESLAVLLDTGTPHASIYMLEIDEDSRLGRELLDGGARYHAALVPSDDAIATMYQTAIETLAHAGLAQYEISNFARPGHASRHNLAYWQRTPYLGVGLDASSMLFAARAAGATEAHPEANPEANPEAHPEPHPSLRFTTTADLAAYLEHSGSQPEPSQSDSPSTPAASPAAKPAPNPAASPAPPIAEQSWLGPVQQLEESWFLGLRCNSGIQLDPLRHTFGHAALEPSLAAAQALVHDGLLETTPQGFALTPRGRLLSNDVFAAFLHLTH